MLYEVIKAQLDSAVSLFGGSNLILSPSVKQTVGGMGIKLKYLIAPFTTHVPPVGFLLSALLLLWIP